MTTIIKKTSPSTLPNTIKVEYETIARHSDALEDGSLKTHNTSVITIDALSTTSVMLPFFSSGFQYYFLQVSDDLMKLEHYIKDIDRSTRMATLLIRNNASESRSVVVYWN